MLPACSSSRCLPSFGTHASALSRFGGCASFAGRRIWRCTGSSMFEKQSTRPLAARFSRAPSRPRALVRLLQVNALASTTGDRSNIATTESVGATTAMLVSFPKVAFRNNTRATAEAFPGQGSRAPSLDTPQDDCSPQGLCPNPDCFGHLLSQTSFFLLSGETRKENDAAIANARLHGARRVRAIKHRISAKRSDEHAPEGPSVDRLSRERDRCIFREKQAFFGICDSAFFTTSAIGRGTLARW
jgi:hypothetical protein